MVPNSKVYLLKNIDLTDDTQLDFDNLAAQTEYMLDHTDKGLILNNDEYLYLRQESAIKVARKIDDLFGVNYLMYNNGDKWYYNRVVGKRYIDEGCTALDITLDLFQTFMFDFQLKESFIEREHQDRYTIDKKPIYNLEGEQIFVGDFHKIAHRKIKDTASVHPDTSEGDLPLNLRPSSDTFGEHLLWVHIVSKEPISTYSDDLPSNVNNLSTNVYYYVAPYVIRDTTEVNAPSYKIGGSAATESNIYCLTEQELEELTQEPKVISIYVSRYCPFKFGIKKGIDTNITTYTATQYTFYADLEAMQSGTLDTPVGTIFLSQDEKAGRGGMYHIRNLTDKCLKIFDLIDVVKEPNLNINNKKSIDFEPKLHTKEFEYRELEFVSQRQKFNNEEMEGSTGVKLYTGCSVNAGQTLALINYEEQDIDTDDMFSISAVNAELPLRTDAWLQYLSTNKASMITGFVTNALQTGANFALGMATGGLGMFAGGMQAVGALTGVANQVAQMADLQNTPDDVKSTSIDLALLYATKDLYIYDNRYQTKAQFRAKAFEYMYHYGYKANTFKVPHLRSRYYFNYVKTINVAINTGIDAEYRQRLADMFNNGITIWHYRSADTFKGINNFEYENVEMSLMEVNNG